MNAKETKMGIYEILAVADEEYAKADLDPNYSPQEHKVGTLEAEHERQALGELAKGIKAGRYPKGSQIYFVG